MDSENKLNKRIFIYEFVWSEDLIRHIIQLCDKKGIEICGWAIRRKDFEILLKVWPEAPVFEAPLPKKLEVIDYNTDLTNGFSFGEEENIRFLLDREGSYQNNMHSSQVRYQIQSWAEGLLKLTQPDWLLFPDVPHNIFTYLLHLCGERRGVNSLMVRRDLAPHFFNLSKTVKREAVSIPNDLDIKNLSPQTSEYLDSLRSDDDTSPTYMRKQKQNSKLFQIIKRALGKGLNLFTKKSIGAVGTYRNRGKLKKTYESYSEIKVNSKHTKPYIVVFLMLQPERSSIPEGGIFAQQWLMIQMLSKFCTSLGWNLYVKEHPSTFMIGPKLYRGKWFYDGLKAMPNVSIVSVGVSSAKILKDAKAIATITGTVGIEAVAKGVPALLFGESPYTGCAGTFKIKDESDLDAAMSSIKDGVHINFDDVKRFFGACEKDKYCLNTGLSRKEDHVAPWMKGIPQSKMFTKIVEFIEDDQLS
ncbi:hypothetical protein LVD15_16170 [Fulvivirga maritima]|uniref:capsular polysaccharide export protein, LipB/KpsS family n=1 Tax=Fulvivirga maritima TaxID=2904247 RepID=UPI001F2A9F11|nr:hypothetical protein [Fulvivirga maritima]UII24839.1 hypothetical protein LVD15_16170 [Fulvivirga maritima]